MSDPFLGEIQVFGFGFAPRNWALAAGQLVPMRQYTALYALYGTTFGGDGQTSFALPNLASRQACGAGRSPGDTERILGQSFGAAGVSLAPEQMPRHNHGLGAYTAIDSAELAATPGTMAAIGSVDQFAFSAFAVMGDAAIMAPAAIGLSGNGDPHENRQPFLGLTCAVALNGVFPTFG